VRYLIDTCIISELIAKHPNQSVLDWLNAQPSEDLYLSVITVGEIAKGIHRLPDSRRKSDLIDWLHRDLLMRFADRIQSLNLETMMVWGELVGRLEPQGRPLPLMDSLIAAIALQGSFHLVTRNQKDFDGTGVQTINPFQHQ
jgi:toxin FitB